MRKFLWMLLLCCFLTGCTEVSPLEVTEIPTTIPETVPQTVVTKPCEEVVYPDPQDMVFVAVEDYLPQVHTELKYATEDNFTGQVVYEFSTVYLRYGTLQKLAAVQTDLEELGLGLKIWDAFRPVAAQYKLWEICPDRRYVANPNTGFSDHSRGNTVDVTLVDSQGREVPMPTGFDDFTKKADRDYSDCSREAADNALILEVLMEKHGFTGYQNEWWHFIDTVTYPVEEAFLP